MQGFFARVLLVLLALGWPGFGTGHRSGHVEKRNRHHGVF